MVKGEEFVLHFSRKHEVGGNGDRHNTLEGARFSPSKEAVVTCHRGYYRRQVDVLPIINSRLLKVGLASGIARLNGGAMG